MQRSLVSLCNPKCFAKENAPDETYNGLHVYLLWARKPSSTHRTKGYYEGRTSIFLKRVGQFPNNNSYTAGKTSCRGSRGKKSSKFFRTIQVQFLFLHRLLKDSFFCLFLEGLDTSEKLVKDLQEDTINYATLRFVTLS